MMGEIWIGNVPEKGNGKGLIYLAGCNRENSAVLLGTKRGMGAYTCPAAAS
jgi:hypothetical protein